MSDQPDQPRGMSFTEFVVSLAGTAAVHFGDLADPSTGQAATPDLDAAAQLIEILSMLEQKTRGNLTLDERQVIETVLYELRMRFVEATSQTRRIVEP